MTFRPYDRDRDREAAHRIWRECGWIDHDNKAHSDAADLAIDSGEAIVAEIGGAAEALALTHAGDMQYLDSRLPMSAVTGITTSLIARKQGLAGRMTAQVIARDAQNGAAVATLGMFDQGFYNRLGFGSGAYEVVYSFDPAALNVPGLKRQPQRISGSGGGGDAEVMHESRLNRARRHGSCSLFASGVTSADIKWSKNGFGIGFFDGEGGSLSHHIWFTTDSVEHGPYEVKWLAYETDAQLIELLSVMKAMGDQVRSIKMSEPSHIQLQDLIPAPFRHYTHAGEGSKFLHKPITMCWWQVRICDVPQCVGSVKALGDTVRFNLVLRDSIVEFLGDDATWRGCGGEYVITFGPESHAEPGSDESLPVLQASVGAFTRLWLGVRPATGLAVTDELRGTATLLERLDQVLRLPRIDRDWEF